MTGALPGEDRDGLPRFGPLPEPPAEVTLTSPVPAESPVDWTSLWPVEGGITATVPAVATDPEASPAAGAPPATGAPAAGQPAPAEALSGAGPERRAPRRRRRWVARRLGPTLVVLSAVLVVMAGMLAMALTTVSALGVVVTSVAAVVTLVFGVRGDGEGGFLVALSTVVAVYVLSSFGEEGREVLAAGPVTALGVVGLAGLLWAGHSAMGLAAGLDDDAEVEMEVLLTWIRHQTTVLLVALLPMLVVLSVRVSDQTVALAGIGALALVLVGAVAAARYIDPGRRSTKGRDRWDLLDD